MYYVNESSDKSLQTTLYYKINYQGLSLVNHVHMSTQTYIMPHMERHVHSSTLHHSGNYKNKQ